MAWSVSFFPFPSQRPLSSYYRTPSASLHKHRLPALLCSLSSCSSHFHKILSLMFTQKAIFPILCICEDPQIWLQFHFVKLQIRANVLLYSNPNPLFSQNQTNSPNTPLGSKVRGLITWPLCRCRGGSNMLFNAFCAESFPLTEQKALVNHPCKLVGLCLTAATQPKH